jgi:hypothetical protein
VSLRLYRVFDWDNTAKNDRPGGPLHVPRNLQGPGRFDIPHLDGVLYASLFELSTVVEALQGFRTKKITNRHFERPDGRKQALAVLELDDTLGIIDLDDPAALHQRAIKPSETLTHDRQTTHVLAERLYNQGLNGILWPSTREASWKNATLFQSRVTSRLRVASNIQSLSIKHPAVIQAVEWLNMTVGRSR